MKITTVELTAADGSEAELPNGIDRRFLLRSETRRWATVVDHYGGETAAWAAAIELCRAGLITLSCTVSGVQLGPPTRWRSTEVVRAHAATQTQRLLAGADTARHILAEAHGSEEPTWVSAWLQDAERSGLLGRSGDDAAALLTAAGACLARLPGEHNKPIGRGELAAWHGGARGAHALDDGHRLTALVLRGIAASTAQAYPRTAAERRAMWASVGVVCDTTSATVLVANFRPEATGLVATQLRARADARLPMHLTARDLADAPIRLGCVPVYVCENPRVLEAALDRGVTFPLVCTAGNPTTVTVNLLRQLAAGGADVRYRGDFDWAGIAIANRLLDMTGCMTWKYDLATYATGVAHTRGDAVPLGGAPVSASWDNELTAAMELHGVAVHEELIIDDLVAVLLAPA